MLYVAYTVLIRINCITVNFKNWFAAIINVSIVEMVRVVALGFDVADLIFGKGRTVIYGEWFQRSERAGLLFTVNDFKGVTYYVLESHFISSLSEKTQNTKNRQERPLERHLNGTLKSSFFAVPLQKLLLLL